MPDPNLNRVMWLFIAWMTACSAIGIFISQCSARADAHPFISIHED